MFYKLKTGYPLFIEARITGKPEPNFSSDRCRDQGSFNESVFACAGQHFIILSEPIGHIFPQHFPSFIPGLQHIPACVPSAQQVPPFISKAQHFPAGIP